MNARTRDWLRLLAWLVVCAAAAFVASTEPTPEPRDVSVPSADTTPVDTFYHLSPEQLRGTCDITSDLQCQRNRVWRT